MLQIKNFDLDIFLQQKRKITEYSFLAALFILPFSKALLEVFLTVAFISWFLSRILDHSPLCAKKWLFMIVGFFIISSSISAIGSAYPLTAARGIVKLIKYSMVFLISVDLFQDPAILKRLSRVMLACFCLILFDSIVQYFSGKDFILGLPLQFTDRQIRVTGPFIFYGLLAAFLIAALPILISVILNKKINWFYKVPIAVLTIISVLLLYKTQSRGAWLAAFGSWLLFALLMRKKILFALLVALFLIIPSFLPHNALIHLDADRKEQSVVERYYLWSRAVDVIKARPLFGCGVNTYVLNYPKFDTIKNWRVPGYYAHNGYLQLAAETGLLSLSLFLCIILFSLISSYRAFLRTDPENKFFVAALISSFTALLLQASVDTTLHNLQSAILIWFMAGLLIAIGESKQASFS